MAIRAYLVGAIEAGGYHLVDDVHQVLRLANDVVHLDEGGRLAHSRLLDGELQCLHIGGHFVQMVEQVLFGVARWDLKNYMNHIQFTI